MPSWFRAYHGISTDPKYRRIAKRSGRRVADVFAVWMHVLDQASQDDDGGRAAVDVETLADFLDLEVADVEAIIGAMSEGAALIDCDDEGVIVRKWVQRQGGVDRTSPQRAKRYRDRKKSSENNAPTKNDTPSRVTQPLRHTREEQNRAEQIRESPTETPSSTSDDAAFEAFWSEAKRKVGKGQARKAFRAASKKADVSQILTAWRLANEKWRREHTDPQYIPHPSTWLNGERWLDVDEARAPPTVDDILAEMDRQHPGETDEPDDAQNSDTRDYETSRGIGQILQLNRRGSGEFG